MVFQITHGVDGGTRQLLMSRNLSKFNLRNLSFVLEPFKCKKGSISRGKVWEKIANNLNGLKLPRFKVSKHAVRERYTLLSEKFKAKMKDEEMASGIECDLSDVEKALEEIAEKEATAEDTVESDKKADNVKAVEMRNRALESLGGTQKRQHSEEEENVKPKQKSRRSGGDTIAHLREKNDLVQKWKEEELQLQKPRVEVEGKWEDQSRKQHQDMMKILVEQTKQQQEQMQSFQQMFTLMQQQQSQIIMKLLEKQN